MSAAIEASHARVYLKYTAYEYYIAKRFQSILDTDGNQHKCEISFIPNDWGFGIMEYWVKKRNFPVSTSKNSFHDASTPLLWLHHYAGYV